MHVCVYVYQHHVTFENGSEYKVASTKIVSTTKSFVKESFEEYSSWHLTAFAKNRFFLDLTRRAMSKGKKTISLRNLFGFGPKELDRSFQWGFQVQLWIGGKIGFLGLEGG